MSLDENFSLPLKPPHPAPKGAWSWGEAQCLALDGLGFLSPLGDDAIGLQEDYK